VHGEQNGSVHQEVTLGRSDVAPVSPLAEYRAGLLERCLHCKHGDHSPHLQPRYTARGAGPGQGLWSPPQVLGFHVASSASAVPPQIGQDLAPSIGRAGDKGFTDAPCKTCIDRSAEHPVQAYLMVAEPAALPNGGYVPVQEIPHASPSARC
jgi:hypothetical protein